MANTTWNPADKSGSCVLSNGNLTATASSLYQGVRSIYGSASGKYYWEITWTTQTSNDSIGVASASASLSDGPTTGGPRCLLAYNANVWLNGSQVGSASDSAVPAGAVVCIALDCTNSLIWFRVGGTGNWNNSSTNNPATGVGGISIAAVLGGLALYAYAVLGYSSAFAVANFGDSAFTGAVPAGFNTGLPGSVAGGAAQAYALVMA